MQVPPRFRTLSSRRYRIRAATPSRCCRIRQKMARELLRLEEERNQVSVTIDN